MIENKERTNVTNNESKPAVKSDANEKKPNILDKIKAIFKDKKKKYIVISIITVILIASIVLIWFFNRKFEVRFIYDNGSEDKVILIKWNKTVRNFDATKDGYNFIGWYKGDNEYNFNTPIKDNLTLKAKWEKANKTVVSITPNPITLIVGNSAKLEVVVSPTNEPVTWASSNSKIVTVYNGVIKALKEGTVTISATTASGIVGNTIVNVKAEVINITATKDYIYNGQVSNIKASVKNANDYEIKWNVTNSGTNGCVKFDQLLGTITSVSKNKCPNGGKTIITATLPSNAKSSIVINIEKQLTLKFDHDNNVIKTTDTITKNGMLGGSKKDKFNVITANQDVEWTISCDYPESKSTVITKTNRTVTIMNTKASQHCKLTAKTNAGQSLFYDMSFTLKK